MRKISLSGLGASTALMQSRLAAQGIEVEILEDETIGKRTVEQGIAIPPLYEAALALRQPAVESYPREPALPRSERSFKSGNNKAMRDLDKEKRRAKIAKASRQRNRRKK